MNSLHKSTLVLFLCILVGIPCLARGQNDGGISPELIDKFRAETGFDGPWRAIYNSLINNEIKDLALDREKVVEHNDLFNVTIKTRGITNQKSSGRCWLFASLNLMRPAMMEKYNLSKFEFSQNYLAFWDKMEKANSFLEAVIELRDQEPLDRELQGILKSPFGDGGWWFFTVDLIEKYGCVPKDAMPETKSSSKTGMMNSLISSKLRKCASELREMSGQGMDIDDLRLAKEDMLLEIYRMLTMNLGVPPTEFEWQYEDKDTVVSTPRMYTPQEFYKDVVAIDLRDYVTLSDHPTRDKYKLYNIERSRNIYNSYDQPFLNVPIDTISEYTRRLLLDGQPVVFACDVGEGNANDLGIFREGIYDYESVYGVDLAMSKADRFRYYDIKPNHMMLITACDTAFDGSVRRWKVENSWGTDRGDNGYWTMYPDWFDEYVFEIIVPRKMLSKELHKMYDQEPVTIPSWDPYSEFFRR